MTITPMDDASWFDIYGSTALFFSVGTALTVFGIVIAVFPWFLARDLQRIVREKRGTASIRRTELGDVAIYLRTQSVWAWRQYARLNLWELVDESAALAEIKRAAIADEISTFGWMFERGQDEFIVQELWRNGALIQDAAECSFRLRPELPSQEYDHVGVATTDVRQVWPRASLARRGLTTSWVRLKAGWSFVKNIPERFRRSSSCACEDSEDQIGAKSPQE